MDSKWAGRNVSGHYDVVIVGAGIMGSCTAYELSKRRLSVLLVEQFDFLHRKGSSHGESRIIRRTYPEDYYTEMMAMAYELWDIAHQDSGFSVLTQTGGLDFGRTDNVDFASVLSACEKHNVPHSILSREEVLNRFGVHLPEDNMAIFSADAGVLHASKACSMFQQLAVKHGAVLRDRAEVTDITAATEAPGRFLITTKRGSVSCNDCVVAAGAWANKLLDRISDSFTVRIQPLQTTAMYWDASRLFQNYSSDGTFPLFINYDDPYIYGMAANEYPGLIKISLHGGPPCDPDSRPAAPAVEPASQILKPWLRERFGNLVDSREPIIAESCMYSMSPDQDFVLDSVAMKGSVSGLEIFVAAGFSGHGFKMGPLVGKIMADLVVHGGCDDVPLGLFSLKRFRENMNGNSKGSSSQVKSYDVFEQL